MWVVVVAKNDPEAEVRVLTRGQFSTADVERFMASTDANIVKEIKEHPERWGLLRTAFDAKIFSVPALTAIEVVHEYADDPLRNELAKLGFSVSGATDAKGRLLDSDLASALKAEPVGTRKRGRKPQVDRLAPFDAIMAVAQTNDSSLNRAVGRLRSDRTIRTGSGSRRGPDPEERPGLQSAYRSHSPRDDVAPGHDAIGDRQLRSDDALQLRSGHRVHSSLPHLTALMPSTDERRLMRCGRGKGDGTNYRPPTE